MATISNPLRDPRVYDFIELAGRENPGIAQVTGFKRPFGWDVKKGKGVKGATLTLGDYPPAEGSIKFLLWLEEHFEQWDEFVEIFQYDRNKKAAPAVDIWHPHLAAIGVDSVVCKEIGQMVHEGKQLYTVTVDLIEYWPPPKKSAVSTPSGSKTGTDKKPGASDDPIADAQQAQIAKLLADAKKP